MPQRLGKSSAYAYYTSKGGTKTPDEFGEMFVDFETVATRAETSATNAAASATSASESKIDAQAAATTATAKAGEATTAAQTATEKAASATASAGTATADANQARNAASTATAKASEAYASATAAQTAKTDAVNAKTAAQAAQAAAETAEDNAAGSATAAAESAASVAGSAAHIAQNTADLLKAFPTDTASGAVASFADGANVPVKSLIVNIDPVQSGNGDPSPDNVRPISGWSEVNVQRTRKNLFDVHFDNTISGTSHLYVLKLKPNTQYTCSSDVPLSDVASVYFGGGSTNVNGVFDGTPKTMTTDANGNIDIYIRYLTSAGGINMYQALLDGTYWIQVEEGATATPYEPYSGTSLNIALGQTVYGGKLDVTKGELVIDRAGIDFGDSPNWINYKTGGFRTILPNSISGTMSIDDPNLITTMYKTYPSSATLANGMASIANGSLYVVNSNFTTDVEEFKTAMAGQKAVYKLATPITVQLTPQEVRSLLGSNNVWADSGDSTVEYRADPTLYIQRLTEPDADMVADANIVIGQYFMVGNTLYKATANIASGATISPNVNCTRKSLSEALNELNS